MGYIKMDTSEFQREFRARVQRSKRTLAEVTDQAGLQILRKAYELTPKADVAAIEALGVTYRDRTKTGKLLKRRRSIFNPTGQFKLIALKAMWKNGPSPRSFGSAQELDAAIKRKLSRRKSSIGFVAYGWVFLMRQLIKKVRSRVEIPTGKRFPNAQGSAQGANPDSWSPYVEVVNATGMSAPGQSAESQNRVTNELETAWRKAVDATVADWADYAAKELEKSIHGEGS